MEDKVPDETLHTKLVEAARRGRLGDAKAAIEAGADVNARDPYLPFYTPLHVAAGFRPHRQIPSQGYTDIARLLIEHGADVNARTDGESTPLHLAVANGHLDIARLLIEKGADVNDGGLLHSAAANGHLDVARLLVEKGADVNARNEGGRTALHSAIAGGHLDIARLLIEHGADAEARDGQGRTPEQWAIAAKQDRVVQAMDRAAKPGRAGRARPSPDIGR